MQEDSSLNKFKKISWILTPFILLTVVIILLIEHCQPNNKCLECKSLKEKTESIYKNINNKDCLDCDKKDEISSKSDTIIDGEKVQKPKQNCRAFFSGRLVTDNKKYAETVVFEPNSESEYVGSGEYPRAINAFPNSAKATFDGIAIDKNTRVIIYSEINFKGNILLDENGPALINNIIWKNNKLNCKYK